MFELPHLVASKRHLIQRSTIKCVPVSMTGAAPFPDFHAASSHAHWQWRLSMATNRLSKIEHIVVVMLENRSFDHLLGFLYSSTDKKKNNVSPLGHPFEGLKGDEMNPDKSNKPVQVFKIQKTDQSSYFMPLGNPGEGFLNTNAQLFGTTTPAPTAKATNQGFVQNFDFILSKGRAHALPGATAQDIMGIYTPEMLPVLSGLARGYAVCDHWYSSAPTETFPNRAFAAMATSQGRLGDAPAPFTAPSIYAALGKKGNTWTIYGYNGLPLALTKGSIADIKDASKDHFGRFSDFKTAAQNGTLANYSFLEPMWGGKGNSQHPVDDVALGEKFLSEVYDALYGSKVWEKTLLIITYDEHGGCYDHVVPPSNATPPDSSVGDDGFDFKRFGVRVPAVLVSPWIAAGTVYRVPTKSAPFDHTSILATVEKRFGLKPLTKRDEAAPHIGGVLTLKKLRTDDPLKGIAPPTSGAKPLLTGEPTHLEITLAQIANNLPIYHQKGDVRHHEPPVFKTAQEAITFAHQRHRDYWRSRGE
jgi:phospholipase C